MEQKIFLEQNRSEFSNNVENAINLALSTKTRLLPNDNVSDNFSLFEQYNRERDNCRKFRLIMAVNPVCSNVLFNNKTEIVVNEGSSACTVLSDGSSLSKSNYAKNALNTKEEIKYIDAIRNTEYSHKENGNFVYHCGVDIFNNHMLRKKEFVHVNKMNSKSIGKCGEVYNTILDFCRDNRGDIVQENFNIKYTSKDKLTDVHLYQYDTIMSMPAAFSDNCYEKDGWWGFTNPGTIEISNNSGNSVSINRMMANNKSCEFIDLYPDRSLYSFIPKFNKFRKRIEKNWDYCITYPYKSDYEMIDEVCGGELQAIRANIKYAINTAGQPIVECSSYFKHNLLPGNYVTFYYYLPHYKILEKTIEDLQIYGNYAYLEQDLDEFGKPKDNAKPYREVLSKEFVKYSIKVKVQTIGDSNGDNIDRVFSVRYSDISEIYENLNNFGCFYKKNNGNTECLYYFRKFKKLRTVTGDEIKSDVNKIAFAKNIYGDDIAQVVFTDDIDIEGLTDHNGRPLSEIYFTIVKRNAGYKEWYYQNNFSDKAIEYSHCFGEITSAIDFCGIDNEPFDYNIHFLHNISSADTAITQITTSIANTFSAWGETILSGVPKTIEKNITIDFDEFYGDIVEYDIYNATETVIGNVYHRFNTAQRECWSKQYKSIVQDSIVSDDYDHANGVGKQWSAATYYINNVKTSIDTNGLKNLMYANISPEGYFYNPHMKIQIAENNDDKTSSVAKYVNYTNPVFKRNKTYLLIKTNGSIEIYNNEFDAKNNAEDGDEIAFQGETYELKITSPVNYGFYKGDFMAFYNKKTMELSWGEITSVSGLEITITFDGDCFKTINFVTQSHFSPTSGDRKLYAYWSTDNVPTYAKFSEGAKKFIWRKIVPPSEMIQDDELYNIPFTNGRFYIEKNVNFFLKRQDPSGKYGLSRPMFVQYEQAVANPMLKFNVDGYNPVDFTEIMYMMNNLTTNCF